MSKVNHRLDIVLILQYTYNIQFTHSAKYELYILVDGAVCRTLTNEYSKRPNIPKCCSRFYGHKPGCPGKHNKSNATFGTQVELQKYE